MAYKKKPKVTSDSVDTPIVKASTVKSVETVVEPQLECVVTETLKGQVNSKKFDCQVGDNISMTTFEYSILKRFVKVV